MSELVAAVTIRHLLQLNSLGWVRATHSMITNTRTISGLFVKI